MIRTIIIDDEDHAQQAIEGILNHYFKNIEIVAKTKNVASSVTSIKTFEPDFLFLDINLPDGTGFDVLKQINYKKYKVIFVTAYKEYAIQAIKFSAFDYILKPFNPVELIQSVNNILNEKITTDYALKYEAFFSNFNPSSPKPHKIVLRTFDKIHVFELDQIIRCESDNTYTTFYTTDNQNIIVSKSIKTYEEMLTNRGFMRVHQSHLINLNMISYFDKQMGGSVIMSDQSNIPVSNQKRTLLMQYLDYL